MGYLSGHRRMSATPPDRVPRGRDFLDHLAGPRDEARIALAAAGDDQPARLAIDGDEIDGDLSALVEIEAGLEPGEDRHHLGLVLAALDIIAAFRGEGHRVERLQQFLVHDLDELVRGRALDPAGNVHALIACGSGAKLPVLIHYSTPRNPARTPLPRTAQS